MLERVSKGYAWPTFGGDAELRSLALHCTKYRGLRDDGPALAIERQILLKAEGCYRTCKWEVDPDFMSRAHFERVLPNIVWDSSPGFPYMQRSPTNKQFFHYDGENCSEQMKQYVWEIIEQRLADRSEADPIRLFVKPEPHKIEKIQQGRLRLISSVSVVDQIIDHMLFDNMNDALTKNWIDVPSKVGWTALKGGWKIIPMTPQLATDKSSWDWTVRPWLIELTLKLRAAMCSTKGELFEKWLDLASYRYSQLYWHPLFIASNGVLLRQNKPGVQKSGCVNTIADNSMQQWILHARVCLEMDEEITPIMAMGDDVIQTPPERMSVYLDRVAQFCLLKEAQLKTEFCGYHFGKRIEPLYRGKHAFNLLHADPAVVDQMANAYALLYHKSVYRKWFRGLFLDMGLSIYPEWVCDYIFDGNE